MLKVALLAVLFTAASLPGGGHAWAQGGRAAGSAVSIFRELPVVQPDWPVPDEPNMLLYLQRSTNPNTVIYAARFDSNGLLDRNRPVEVYWRRYNTDGVKKKLGFFEEKMAFGVSARRNGKENEFDLRIVAFPERTAKLVQDRPGSATLTLTTSDGRLIEPVYAYVEVAEDGILPKVARVKVFGKDVSTGQAVVETISVK
ncbi:DUF4833 domain-containing protein [Rhizobiales bacterium]|uniref:DUF4833 domain-containing protein n=1 Tax=Hongsoonwoonella zoysiae TaxID=2821844 RepID=UPI0015607E84|nr:DUF4833 domain-containing protein [Hongsoonwoonella zoysiae]NRG16658.1 DUF4833 domain-containing protein [Hongsoonwoonella zoysiae]